MRPKVKIYYAEIRRNRKKHMVRLLCANNFWMVTTIEGVLIGGYDSLQDAVNGAYGYLKARPDEIIYGHGNPPRKAIKEYVRSVSEQQESIYR